MVVGVKHEAVMPEPFLMVGTEMRIGLHRIAGAALNRKYYAWQVPEQTTHMPQVFGHLRPVE
jgi:hypothetical protein